MILVVAYAAVALGGPAAAPGEPPSGVNAYGQPTGPAALTSPPTHGGKVVDAALVGVTGVAATVTAARGGDADDRLGSISLDTRRLGYAYDRGLIVRVSNAMGLGGNDRGVHGGLSFEAAGGYRFAVGETHGPFVRAGAAARVAGDALVYQSLLEIPEVHAGYQYLVQNTLLEVASRGGFAELGRSNTGHDATRHLDHTPQVGAMASARTPYSLVLLEWSHFLPTDRGGPTNWVDADLCATYRRFAVCTDIRLVAGDVNLRTGESAPSSVTQVGMTLGLVGK